MSEQTTGSMPCDVCGAPSVQIVYIGDASRRYCVEHSGGPQIVGPVVPADSRLVTLAAYRAKLLKIKELVEMPSSPPGTVASEMLSMASIIDDIAAEVADVD